MNLCTVFISPVKIHWNRNKKTEHKNKVISLNALFPFHQLFFLLFCLYGRFKKWRNRLISPNEFFNAFSHFKFMSIFAEIEINLTSFEFFQRFFFRWHFFSLSLIKWRIITTNDIILKRIFFLKFKPEKCSIISVKFE